MERWFQILAVALIVAAAVFLWFSETDVAFVCGVLAACAFFLSIRLQFKQKITERQPPDNETVYEKEDDDAKAETHGL